MTDENLPKKSYQKIVEVVENETDVDEEDEPLDDRELTDAEIQELKFDNAVRIATKIKLYCEREMIPLFNQNQATNIFVDELIKFE